MPRDFRSFLRENEQQLKEEESKKDEYENIINKYKDMSSSELMSALLNEASKLKSEGKLDKSTLDILQSTLSPLLNEDQNNLLNSILKTINEQK